MSQFTSETRAISKTDIQDIMCNKCDITFGMRKSLYAHIRKFHAEENLSMKGNQICGMCNEGFRTISQLHEHLQSQHEVGLNFIEEKFYAETDFMEWKCKIEKNNQASFVLKNGSENKETMMKFSYYKCHRSGVAILKAGRKRSIKASGSIKTGITCPAMIKVASQTVADVTEMKVLYQSVHVGHDLQVDTLRLSKDERTSLASSLRAGVPISKILDKTRAAYSPTKRFSRIKRQDLYNICRDYNINRKMFIDSDDSTSVQTTQHQNPQQSGEDSPVIDQNKDKISVEKDNAVASDLESRKIKFSKELLELGKRVLDLDSAELLGFMEEQIKVMKAFAYSSLPEFHDRYKAPPNKLIGKQR